MPEAELEKRISLTEQFFGSFPFDDSVSVNLYGKREKQIRKAVFTGLSFLSVGSLSLFAYWFPKFKSWATMVEESFFESTHILVVSCYKAAELIKLQTADTSLSVYEIFEADHALTLPKAYPKNTLVFFDYQYNRFFLNPFTGRFVAVCQFPSPVYDLNLRDFERRKIIFGENILDIKAKPLAELIVEHLAHPFNVFQFFSVIIWLSEEYEFYAGCILLMTLFSLVVTVKETKANSDRIRSLTKHSSPISILRGGKWIRSSTEDIVPGDIFAVDQDLVEMPCDAVLIKGEAIVDESMLTGETTPISKSAIDESSCHLKPLSHIFSLTKHSLFSGTRLLRARAASETTALAMAYRTGFLTQKGSLIQSILFPRPDNFEYHKDSMCFIGILAAASFVVFSISVVNLTYMGVEFYYIATRALDLITVILPPALPATLSIGITSAIKRLKKQKIFCVNPPKINVASKVERICFDKTGTLTEDGLKIHEIFSHGDHQKIFSANESSESVSKHNRELFHLFATCHSLKQFAGRLVGDPLEVEMFDFTGLHLSDSTDASLTRIVNCGLNPGHISDVKSFEILREFEFNPELRRMSVLVSSMENPDRKLVYTKGSPEFIRTACNTNTVPHNFEEVLKHYAKNGFRVIACAYKQIDMNSESAKSLARVHFESHLNFLGFIAFENKLKPATIPTLIELKQADMKTAMVTGDNLLTAISVSRACGIISADDIVYCPRSYGSSHMHLAPIDGTDQEKCLELGTVGALESPIACSGDYFDSIVGTLNDDLLKLFLSNCNIFGRMSPNQKRRLVETYQRLGESICFCGDGANDCAALMAADVGVSLSQAESSVAAPFTSNICDISCIPKLIMNGRSSLVTAFVSFKFMSLYSMIQFTTLSLLYTFGSSLSDWQFIYMDLILILPLGILINQYGPSERLSKSQPNVKLISKPVLSSIFVQMGLQAIFQCVMFYLTRQKFSATTFKEGPNVENIEATTLSLFSVFMYITQAFVFSEGHPHRQSYYLPLLGYIFLAIGMSCVLVSWDNSYIRDLMQFVEIPKDHKLVILGLAIIYLISAFLGNLIVRKLNK